MEKLRDGNSLRSRIGLLVAFERGTNHRPSLFRMHPPDRVPKVTAKTFRQGCRVSMNDEIRLLKLRIEELEELHQLAESLAGSSSVDEVLSAIVDTSQQMCHADNVAILLFSPSSRHAAQTLIRSVDPSRGGIDHGLNLIIAGWIEHHDTPLFTGDILAELNISSPAERWRELGPAIAVPLVSAGKTVGIINLLNRRGAPEFTRDTLKLASTIARLASQFIVRVKLHESLFQDNVRLKTVLRQAHGGREILGTSRTIRELRQKISVVASSTATVLLVGETGTGKELVARAIHFESARAEKPFVAINCSAIPATLFESELFGHERGSFTGASAPQKGKIELANEGTLFLDEIAEMPMDLQPKLLRSLEERTFYRLGSSTEIDVDVRVVAASSKNLHLAVREGKFRDDLFHRLNVLPIGLPPLRERQEDIPLLAGAFLEEFSRGAHQFLPDAVQALQELPWKGNVRELRNAVERLCIFVPPGDITASDLKIHGIIGDSAPDSDLTMALLSFFRTTEPDKDVLEELEKMVVGLVLREWKGNVSQAARILRIDRNALQRRIEKYGIKD